MKILVVEDESYARQSLIKQISKLMGNQTHQILETANGLDGLACFKKELPDIVFSDIRMPRMSGLKLLKEIKKINPRVTVVIVSGYADFEYAKEAINTGADGYLLKPVVDQDINELLKKLTHTKEEKEQNSFQDDVMVRFLNRYILDSENVEKDFVYKNIFLNLFPMYRIIFFHFFENIHTDIEKLLARMRKQFPIDASLEYRMVELSGRNWIVVLKNSKTNKYFIQRLSRFFIEHQIDIYLGISNEVAGLEKIKMAYRQAEFALKNKIFSNEKLLFFEKLSHTRNNNIYIDEKQIEKLSLYLYQCDEHNAMRVVDMLLKQQFDDSSASVSCLESLLFRISSVFYEMINLYGKKYELLDSSKMEFSTIDFNSESELKDAISDKIHMLCKLISHKEAEKNKNVVRMILDYIEEHCGMEMSLKELAEEVFFLNPAYLSQLIRKETGISYSTYLRQVRMERAKKYLKEESFSITTVASLSGFHDTSQFIHSFQREIGLTPKKYRDSFQKTREESIQ